MKKIFLLSFIILAIVCTAYSEKLLLQYLDGVLEVKEDDSWVEADVGDSFSSETILKVGEDTIAELESGNLRLTLTTEGIYSVAKILDNNKKVASWGIGSTLSAKLNAITGSSQKSSTAVMGVRGAAADSDQELKWMDEDEELLLEGKKLLEAEQYREAIDIFREGFEIADPEKEQKYLFYLGYAHAMLGEKPHALKYLTRVDADISKAYFSDLVLVKGQLLVESLAFKNALELFDIYLKSFPEGDNTQAACFLSEICLQGMNNNKQALIRLEKARDIDPDSDLGRAAEQGIGVLKR